MSTLTDANPNASAGMYTVTVSWGDGVTTSGTVVPDPSGALVFDVTGSHSYAQPGLYAVVVTASDAGGQSTTSSGTATVTPRGSGQALTYAATAAAFNQAVSGAGSNAATFDFGYGNTAPAAPVVNAPTSNATVTTNSALMGVAATSAPLASASYKAVTPISQSGTGFTLGGASGVGFTRTVTGTATSGTFSESFSLTTQYHYHQVYSTVLGPGSSRTSVYDEIGTSTYVTTVQGSYVVTAGVMHVVGTYATAQSDSVTYSLITTAVAAATGANNVGASNLVTTQFLSGHDAYSEGGAFHTDGSATLVAGASALTSTLTTSSSTAQARTYADGGSTLNLHDLETQSARYDYTENDAFLRDATGATVAGSFLDTESGLRTSARTASADSATDHAIGSESALANFSLSVLGSISQRAGASTYASSFTLTQAGTGTLTLAGAGTFTDPWTAGVYSFAATDSQAANATFAGTDANLGAGENLSGLLTLTGSDNGTTSVATAGTFVWGSTVGSFSTSGQDVGSSHDMATTQVVGVNGSLTAFGTVDSTAADASTFTAAQSGSYNDSGDVGHFSSTSSGVGATTVVASSRFVSGGGVFTAGGHVVTQWTGSSSGGYDDGGASSSTSTGGTDGLTHQAVDVYTDSERDNASTSGTLTTDYTQGAAGLTVNGFLTQSSQDALTVHSTDDGTDFASGSWGVCIGSQVDVTKYHSAQNSSVTGSSTLVAASSQGERRDARLGDRRRRRALRLRRELPGHRNIFGPRVRVRQPQHAEHQPGELGRRDRRGNGDRLVDRARRHQLHGRRRVRDVRGDRRVVRRLDGRRLGGLDRPQRGRRDRRRVHGPPRRVLHLQRPGLRDVLPGGDERDVLRRPERERDRERRRPADLHDVQQPEPARPLADHLAVFHLQRLGRRRADRRPQRVDHVHVPVLRELLARGVQRHLFVVPTGERGRVFQPVGGPQGRLDRRRPDGRLFRPGDGLLHLQLLRPRQLRRRRLVGRVVAVAERGLDRLLLRRGVLL